MASIPESIEVCWLGRVPFDRALALQLERRERLIDGDAEELVLVCEHEATIALGVRAEPSHVLWDAERLAEVGLSVCSTPRGGEATLHAPGQLVAYPIMQVGRKIRSHIETMADSARELCLAHGVADLEFNWEHPGLWRAGKKFASVGVHVRRGVTVQGLSLNIDVELGLFDALISCGMPQVTMANLVDEADCSGRPEVQECARHWVDAFAARVQRTPRWIPASDLVQSAT